MDQGVKTLVFKRDVDVKALVLFLFEDSNCKLVALVLMASFAEKAVEDKYFITCLAVLPGSSCCISDPTILTGSGNQNLLPQKSCSTNNQD